MRLQLGQLAFQMKDGERALQIFSKLVEAEPNGLTPLFEFGRTLKAMGRLDEASVVLTRYLQLAQGLPDEAERVAIVKQAFTPPGTVGAIPTAKPPSP